MIVDDHAGVRDMIRRLVCSPMDAVCECGSADEAVHMAPVFKPDHVTMDLHMPGRCSFDGMRALRAAHPAARIIVVASDDQPEFRQAAATSGAIGYVVKEDLAMLRQYFAPPARNGGEPAANRATI